MVRKNFQGAKFESPLQDDYLNTEDIEVWELQGRMRGEDECQEWERWLLTECLQNLGQVGWSQVRWSYTGVMAPGPVPLQSLLNPLGSENVIQVGPTPSYSLPGFLTFCVSRHSGFLPDPPCHTIPWPLLCLLSRRFSLPSLEFNPLGFAQLTVSHPLSLSFNCTFSGKASLAPVSPAPTAEGDLGNRKMELKTVCMEALKRRQGGKKVAGLFPRSKCINKHSR